MRTFIGLLVIVAALAATWTSFQAWGRRTPAGRMQDTPGLALGRLDHRKYFTYAGWRYRTMSAVLYVVIAVLGFVWVILGGT